MVMGSIEEIELKNRIESGVEKGFLKVFLGEENRKSLPTLLEFNMDKLAYVRTNSNENYYIGPGYLGFDKSNNQNQLNLFGDRPKGEEKITIKLEDITGLYIKAA